MVEVEPEADPLRQAIPLLQEREHRRAALRVEALDTDLLLDLGLRGDAQLLFDGDLDREAVAVPSALSLDAEPAHRLKARVDVLEHTREDVVGARRPVRGRRALVEDPLLGSLAQLERALEHVALAPAGEHVDLEGRQLLAGIDLPAGQERMS